MQGRNVRREKQEQGGKRNGIMEWKKKGRERSDWKGCGEEEEEEIRQKTDEGGEVRMKERKKTEGSNRER